MPEDIKIRRITDECDLDLMTRWMYSWWGEKEGYSYEAVRCCLSHSLKEKGLPQTYGLYVGGRLIGMYQFTYSDLFPRPDIYPWLANVYLEPEFRGKGFGRMLLASVERSAAAAGLAELYLFTVHSGLYEQFGWKFVEEIDTYLEPRIQRLYKLKVVDHEGER